MRIIILEDNASRRREMQLVLMDKFPAYAVEFFTAVAPMMERLASAGLYDVALISLDHDLELSECDDGSYTDPGAGVEIAEWLSKQPTLAPVIVHTTNTVGGDRMVEMLRRSGWNCERVCPYGGEDWIAESWLPVVRRLIVAHSPPVTLAGMGLRILKSDMQNGDGAEKAVSECINAARCRITGSGEYDGIAIQLLYLGSNDRFAPLIPSAPIIEEFGWRAIREELSGAVDLGPVEPRSFSLEITDMLEKLGVRELQIDTVHWLAPAPMQALMVVASLSEKHQLASHHVQSTIADLRELIEITMLMEMQKSQSSRGRKPTNARGG